MHQFDQDDLANEKPSRKPYRHGAKCIPDRKLLRDCEFGDVLRLPDGRTAIVTAIIRGHLWGRYLSDGAQGRFELLPQNARVIRLRGYR